MEFLIPVLSVCPAYFFTQYYLPKQENKSLATCIVTISLTSFLIKATSSITGYFAVSALCDIFNGLVLFWLFPLLYMYEFGGYTFASMKKYASAFMVTIITIIWLEIVWLNMNVTYALETAKQAFQYLLVISSFGSAHIYGALGIVEMPRVLLSQLFDHMYKFRNYNHANKDACVRLTIFETKNDWTSLTKEQNSEYSLLWNDVKYTEQKLAKLRSKSTRYTFISTILQFVSGVISAMFSLTLLTLLIYDVISRTITSPCGLACGFTGTVTESQKTIHYAHTNILSNLPILALIYYTVSMVGGVLSLGIGTYEFRKNATQGFTIIILWLLVILSSYSGSAIVDLLGVHLWIKSSYPAFINMVVYLADWTYVCISIVYLILTLCTKYYRGTPF